MAPITGGGGGIGRATASGFALRGAKVMVVDANANSGHASVDIVAQGGAAAFVQGRYECEACGEKAVYGAEELLFYFAV